MSVQETPGPAPADSNEDELDDIVAECLEVEPAELDTAIERACSTHPAFAAEIRKRIAALRQVGLVARPKDEDAFPERLGDFQLLARLGGGGMGIVFRARQISLGREVALKIIRPENLYFPKARERFRRETEAVTRLQHPGIVPIHTVGEENGVPYFAMELVAGATLAEVVRELQGRAPESLTGGDLVAALRARCPTASESDLRGFERSWIESCVRIAIQVADALHHAHSRGVLHRDVKPSNIALTLDGRAMLLDFGLATMGEASARVTASGSAIGTLLYMAPEQIRGDLRAIDARTDQYALGVTLYETLTLQAPYFETNPVGTRQAILDGKLDAIRARNRAVPRDLETVCFKAMERDPAQRYADVAEFARDLRNVLELRPIEARTPSSLARAWRWTQRNPAVAVAAGLTFVLVAGVPLALYFSSREHARVLEIALGEARDARAAAERSAEEVRVQRDRAQLEARDSAAVSEFLVELFGAADPANARGNEASAIDLLEAGAARLDAELQDQPVVRWRLRTRIGSSFSARGAFDRAVETLREGLAESIELFGEESLESAEARYRLATALRPRKPADAQPLIGDALRIATAKGAPAESLVRYLVEAGANASALKDHEGALVRYDEAREQFARLSGDTRKLDELWLSNQAFTLNALKRFEPAVECAQRAIAIQRELHGDAHPGLLACLNTLGIALKNLGRLEEAAPVFDELLAVGERVHGRESTPFAIFTMNHAGFLEDRGLRAEAAATYEEAWELFGRVAPPTLSQALTCRANMAGVYSRLGRWSDAERAFAEVFPRLVEADGPTSTRAPVALNNLALAREALGRFELARDDLRRAIEMSASLRDSSAALRRARMHGSLARMLVRLGELAEAEQPLAELGRYVAENPTRTGTAAAWKFCRARLALERGGRAEAEALLRELAAQDKLDEDVRWLLPAARSRLAAWDGDLESAERARVELDTLLGERHVESLAALASSLECSERAGDESGSRRLRDELERRRTPP
jgi:serine/threonine protein kinase